MTALHLQEPSSRTAEPREAAAAPAAAVLLPLGATALERELAATAASFLQPSAFFVSWQGVLTLAFRWELGAAPAGACGTRPRALRRPRPPNCLCSDPPAAVQAAGQAHAALGSP